MAPAKCLHAFVDKHVNKFMIGKRLKLHNNCATFKEGRKGSRYLDISVKSKNLDYKSKKLDFTGASKSVIDQKTISVGYSFFDTFDEFASLDKSLSISAS